MKSPKFLTRRASDEGAGFRLGVGIGSKIILPYFLLTLVIASVGTFVVINLVTSSLEERIINQLLDAGRIVSEGMVGDEEERLQTLRAVAGTEGVAAGVVSEDSDALAALVPQIIANSDTDAVELLNADGVEVYGWRKAPNQEQSDNVEQFGVDFSEFEEVRQVLRGAVDRFGNRRILLIEAPEGLIVFTAAPLLLEGEQVGAVMVGTYLENMLFQLTLNAVARVTVYDRQGQVIDTTLSGNQGEIGTRLQESPERYRAVAGSAAMRVPLREVEVGGQQYLLAFGDWRLRGQSFGMFSVALPSNFIVNAAATSRNLFVALFTMAIAAVFSGGIIIARRITKPLYRLVETAKAVTEGDLEQRSGIQGGDEIGKLATSFDQMTETLARSNRQLLEKASELEAIVESIADGVLVLDADDQIVTMNAAAQHLLADMAYDFASGPLRELTASLAADDGEEAAQNGSGAPEPAQQPRRYQIGNRILSALAAPVQTPQEEKVGTVVVLRDITREAEAEHLKDAFITSISHELRTPLTVIKVYADLMQSGANGELDERQRRFIQNINKGSQQLEHHINQLINLSEIQAGTINMDKERLDFGELVNNVADHWRERLEQKELSLTLDRPQESVWINADAGHLSWAIDNLLSNALNYTPAGGRVSLHVLAEQDNVRLLIADSGIGIATADQPHLFDRFFRAASEVNYTVHGVGLGLYISRAIVEMHGGHISVESESGVGSTFTIALPRNE